MAKSPAKPSVSKSKPIKYSLSYVRVSTKDQLDGSGIKRQEKAYQEWLRRNTDYENFDEFKDLGISGRGKNSTAGALNKIIEKAEKGQIPHSTCLVVESMSRLSREVPKEVLGLLLRIFKSGLTIAFTEYGGKVFDGQGNDPVWFQILGAMMQASIEWQTKRERIVGAFDVVQENLENGILDHFKAREKGTKHGLYSFWLNFDEDKKQFIVLEEEAEIVRKIFTMAETMGVKKIERALKDQGIKNPIGFKTEWFTRNVIRKCILENRVVLGEKVFRGKTYFGIYPAIITPEQYNLVQEAKQKRITNKVPQSPHHKVVNLFQGAIFCSECGGRIEAVGVKRYVCKEFNVKNSEKIEAEYFSLHCSVGRNQTSNICSVTNAAAYKQLHNGIDNELAILEQIKNFRWAEFFTDERHENDLQIEKDKRTRYLNERNKVSNQIEKYKTAEEQYFEQGEILPLNLRDKKNQAKEKYDDLNEKYNRANLDIQNLKRKKTGKSLEEDINKRVKNFINKGRFDNQERFKFNMWLKEMGMAIQVDIYKQKQTRKIPHKNYAFHVGIGMFDFITGKYRGLNQSIDDLVALGLDEKQVKESEAKIYENYKKQSLEVGYDIRFPKPKKEVKPITKEEFYKKLEVS